MAEQAPDRIWSGIDIPKTIAGTLAAVSAAVVGSFLGVGGTLAGAAIASVIGSVGTEVYDRSFKKGRKKLETLAPSFVKAPAAVGTPAVAAATEEDSPSHTVREASHNVSEASYNGPEASPTAPEAAVRQIRWRRVAVVAGALFVLAVGTLTVFELATGKSVASTVGNHTGAKTTIGGVLDGGDKPASTPTPAPSATPTDTSPTTAPTTAPSTEAPTATTAPATSAPATQTTTAPATTGGPDQGPTAGTPQQNAP
jgi:hypothetical protein